MEELNSILKYSQKLKLLYVEDNKDAREMTITLLKDFFGHITIAVDGEDGLEKFKNDDFDLVITDINMPRLSGLEMSKAIRVIKKTTPIIIISAHNEEDIFLDSIQMGVNGYILKPIDITQFTNILFQVIQRYKYMQQSRENLHFLEVYQEAVNLSSIVSKTDLKGIITYVNEPFCQISGFTKEELIGKNHNIVRHPNNPKSIFYDIWKTISKDKKVWKGVVKNRAKNGKSYYVDSVIIPIMDLNGKILEYISLRHDITEVMNHTKLLKNHIKDSQDSILVYMKLDKYDIIEEFYDSDSLELIQEKAMIYLQKRFSKRYKFDRIYSLDNGEYAILIDCDETKCNDKEKFIKNLKELQDDIKNDKILLDEFEYDIAILLSVVYDKQKVLDSARLGIKYLIKSNKDFIISNDFVNQWQQKAKENMKTVFMIKHALENQNIISYFQPIVDNKTKQIVKYESLVRLIDENKKVISPFFFLDTAKKSNYYDQITNIVLAHSFSVLKKCNVDISINLSPLDIERKATREYIFKLLDQYKDFASRVVFELLEDESVKEFDTIKRFISDVKKYGVKIAIDDFGAGYSNYERLLNYQPDILKIDGCLIVDIETSSYSLSAVKSIVTFAKEQNLQTVAEYIENESIFNIIRDLGVDFSQGYYFGKPELLDIENKL